MLFAVARCLRRGCTPVLLHARQILSTLGKTAFQQGSGDAEDAVSHAGSFITESLYLSRSYTVFTTMPAQVLGTHDRQSTNTLGGAQVTLRQFHATFR